MEIKVVSFLDSTATLIGGYTLAILFRTFQPMTMAGIDHWIDATVYGSWKFSLRSGVGFATVEASITTVLSGSSPGNTAWSTPFVTTPGVWYALCVYETTNTAFPRGFGANNLGGCGTAVSGASPDMTIPNSARVQYANFGGYILGDNAPGFSSSINAEFAPIGPQWVL